MEPALPGPGAPRTCRATPCGLPSCISKTARRKALPYKTSTPVGSHGSPVAGTDKSVCPTESGHWSPVTGKRLAGRNVRPTNTNPQRRGWSLGTGRGSRGQSNLPKPRISSKIEVWLVHWSIGSLVRPLSAKTVIRRPISYTGCESGLAVQHTLRPPEYPTNP